MGSALAHHLRQGGHEVVSLSRIRGVSSSIFWNPLTKEADPSRFEGFDSVFHLAGEPLSFGRWSGAKKKEIWVSRIETTRFLVDLFSKVDRPPSFFLSASAVGYYGDRGDAALSEESEPGKGFLAGVCQDWEMASFPLEKLGVRRLVARFGVVLDPAGGALKKILPIFRMGLGAVLGSGEQWMSWISRVDLVRSLVFLMEKGSVSGPVNCVAPTPLRQKEFAHQVAEMVHRKCWLKIPASLLRLGLGESANEMVLASTRVIPQKLLDLAFPFMHPDRFF